MKRDGVQVEILLILFVLIAPGVLAAKGSFHRGGWLGLALVSLLVGLVGCGGA